MMTPRENVMSLYKRQGYETAPVHFNLCDFLENVFAQRYPDRGPYCEVFEFPMRMIVDPGFPWIAAVPGFVPERTWDWDLYYDPPIAPDARIDIWGTAHEPGGEHCYHMTHMRHPLERLDSLEQLQAYPWPAFDQADWSYLEAEVRSIHEQGCAAQVWMECTIWETAWYLRRMDILMAEMALGDEKAVFLLDTITDLACLRARRFAEAGVDILALGDDVGMQQTTMMSQSMYRDWLKPRLAKVIAAARAANPGVVVQYHSCGYVTPLIGDFIEAGIDVLNPVQPECMEFEDIHEAFGDRLAFNGTIGTQSLMPFGTPDEIRRAVFDHLSIAGDRGGLLCCPTHMLEPEVPWQNVEAYVQACRDFR